MTRRYVFADESGNFDFSRKPGASRYYILTSITANDCRVGDVLLDLRREMAWDGEGHEEFHATTDAQATRNRVFAALGPLDFRIDATIIEKSKLFMPAFVEAPQDFYSLAWISHATNVLPNVGDPGDDVLVVSASIGTAARRRHFMDAFQNAVTWFDTTRSCRAAYWSAASEPCLQVADYCSWAVQRKWERNDLRSYDLIRDKIASEVHVTEDHVDHY